jgi:SAM-dependent methyltransferase/alkylhydroperoxidase family enzyme
VDEGWGRQAVEFATLSEPANCREYVALHQHLGVGPGDRLLDVACGAGLAVELAAARGATCAGIDASPRLIGVARDRLPDADIRVGDMHAMPWEDASFDVVTSFRGIWGTTPAALTEVLRVLKPGGRIGLTVWGHNKASPGAWALSPFRLAAAPKVANQAAMVALGRPGVGEDLLASAGFVGIERVSIPFVWEFADPDAYARALASTGPAYEAIQAVGEEEFLRSATELASERVRDGLPLRAEIAVAGFIARKPVAASPGASGAGFLGEPEMTDEAQELFDSDLADNGYVMNVSRLWAHQPEAETSLFELLGQASRAAGLTIRQRGILVTACTSTLGDSYCSLAWGNKLAGEAGAEVAGSVLRGDDEALDASERALAAWARTVTRDANSTTPGDLDALRTAGFDDAQILAITLFVSLRMAFAVVNGALGAQPDWQIGEAAPPEVRDAVAYGRPIGAAPGA